MRYSLVALALAIAVSSSLAQDMPLSQVLIDGEGWGKSPDIGVNMTPVQIAAPGVEQATCRVKSADGGTMYVGSRIGQHVWAFRLERDGTLTAGQPYCALFAPRGTRDMPVTALTVDRDGRVYAATPAGIQVFDPTGRLCGVMTAPTRDPIRMLAFNGEKGDRLYAVTATMPYSRKVKTRGLGFAK